MGWADEHDTSEERSDAKDTIARDATDPDLLRRLRDFFRGPVASFRDDQGKALLVGDGDTREAMPLEQRVVGNSHKMSRLGCD